MRRRSFIRGIAATVAAFFVVPKAEAASPTPIPTFTFGNINIAKTDRKPIIVTDAAVYTSNDGGVTWQSIGLTPFDWDA